MKLLLVAAALLVVVNAKGMDLNHEEREKRLLFDIITGGGGSGTASSYIPCCAALPQLDAMVNEANQLRLAVQACQGRLQQVVDKIQGAQKGKRDLKEKRGLFDLLKAPLQIATSVIKLPFQIAGQIAAVPFNIAKSLTNIVAPILGEQFANVLRLPIDFAQRLVQIPFQFGEKVVQLPYGLVDQMAGWSWKDRQEMELAKKCCMTLGGLGSFLDYVKNLKEGAAICEAKLNEMQKIVDDLLNKPECPQGFVYMPPTGKCYSVFGNPAVYDDGQKLCVAAGGVLASIRSDVEQKLIESIAEQLPKGGVCGCNRGGSCYTTSGQTLNPNTCSGQEGRLVWKPKPGYYMEIGYTKWKSGEPNCYGGNEHCIVLDTYFKYEWNDYPCNTKSCPICEADPKPKTIG